MATSPPIFQIVLREIDSLKRETLLLNLSTHSHYLSFTDKSQNNIFTINAFYVHANEVKSIGEKCLSGQQVQRILGPSSQNERGELQSYHNQANRELLWVKAVPISIM